MKIGRIFYLIPDYTVPCGGIYTRYLHCMFLRKHGYKAFPLHLGNFKLTWFENDLEIYRISDIGYELLPDDIIVAYEFHPYRGLEFQNAFKIMFVQNWGTIYYNPTLWRRISDIILKDNLHGLKLADKNKNYLELGYNAVITVSDYVTNYIRNYMGINAVSLTNGIDLKKFVPDPCARLENVVLCLPRKNKKDIKRIKKIISSQLIGEKISWTSADGLSHDELVIKYQCADILLATGYPEGFARPPLEAMACGCVVVGFTGGGAMYMRDNETALVAPDGDCNKAAENLIKLMNDKFLKEKIRQQGYDMVQKFSLDKMEKRVIDFYQSLESSGRIT